MIKYLLDTNIVIYTINNRPQEVREAFKKHQGLMAVSTVTVGELAFGTEKSMQQEKSRADIDGLLARLEIFSFDEKAAAHFGQIRGSRWQGATHDAYFGGTTRIDGLSLSFLEFISLDALIKRRSSTTGRLPSARLAASDAEFSVLCLAGFKAFFSSAGCMGR